ncbi:sigma-70 family RNA polymerase sigma factor [Myxococcota bacterium]|nr:sigma-70 family RNA polymerase sigma factor [Myxococcota bacterium]
MTPAEEQRLVKRLKRREEHAFHELVVRHQSMIYGLCVRMLGHPDEAEDVAQDVFVRSFQAIDSFRGDSSLGTWLYRIAINLCKNRLKYLGRRRHGSGQTVEDVPEGELLRSVAGGLSVGEPAPRPDEALSGNQTESLIQRALAAVEPDFRELLVLRDIDGLSYAEVMVITGLAEGTVKSRLHRARLALKTAYEALLRS